MIDACGRNIRYLRLSVTERCNLNCLYCSPAKDDPATLLTPGEIARAVRVFVELGVDKIRITGGEPLVRGDLEDIVSLLSAIPGVTDLPMTTNGVGLDGRIRDLVAAGVNRFNISLDTLDRRRYREITRVDGMESVLRAVDLALSMGINVKLNAVLIRGVNDMDLPGFVDYVMHTPVQVRFIELMPIGEYGEDNQDKVIPPEEVLAAFPQLTPKGTDSGGVARVYTAPGMQGSIGFISPVSHKFCDSCNRVRLTADGRIRPCLGDNGEVDIRPFLQDDAALYSAIREAVYHKPAGHHFESGFSSSRDMQHIGG